MPTIVVPLDNILTDADNLVDLSALSADQAVERIKEIYSFLPLSVEITVGNGVATITIADEMAQPANQALRTLEQASRLAKQGKYSRAIPLFQEVLRVLPEHTESRRELAMALMETGSIAAAKKHLIRVLQLDPNDSWAFLILGNLYFHHEQDLGSAERYYQSAHDLAPDDAYILTSYGGLLAKRNRFEEAAALLSKAVEKEPAYPNPRYGLALCQYRAGNKETALNRLEDLFAIPASADPRHAQVYEQAHKLYLEIQREVAEAQNPHAMEMLREAMDEFASQSGYPVELYEDSTLQMAAISQPAWVHGRKHHLIKYRTVDKPALAHRIAHEFEHLLMLTEARAAGRNRLFSSNQTTEQNAARAIDKDLRKLRRRQDERTIVAMLRQIIPGLANQLFNSPLDLIIDARVYEKYPFLHASQFVSMSELQNENLQAITDGSIRDVTPLTIYQASISMNAAHALFMDTLFGGVTDFAVQYRPSGLLEVGRQLYGLWQKTMEAFQPGDEYDLVDKLARVLKLESWYTWLADGDVPAQTAAPSETSRKASDNTTDMPLLQEPVTQMAAAMYMVSAMKRFEDMDKQEIMQIAGEIGLLGNSGLDYSSSEKKYTLRSVPGENFSGLQLMCLMYVGFKKVKPDVDTGIPLDETYQRALSMYQAGK